MEGNLSPTIRGTFLWDLRIHSPHPHPPGTLFCLPRVEGNCQLRALTSTSHT